MRFLADPALGGDREARIAQVEREIDRTGTYRQTSAEKLYGCKRAWAKHARCIGSPGWNSLALVDLSDTVVDEQGIGHAARRHLRHATNNPEVNGGILALITLVAVDRPGRPAPLIWNEQLIRYQSDPKYSALVAAVRRLGWVDEPDERFAPIPLVVQFPGREPVLIPITPADFREVSLAHSRHPWFAELNLRWMTAPTISGMRVVIGGLSYACFFNGWYVLTEVLENLGAPDRYNQLPVIARHLGLLGRRTDPLWQDKASVVLLEAILESYRVADVTIELHHRADERHHRYLARERERGVLIPGDKDALLMPASVLTLHARTAHYSPPAPDEDPAFVWPSRPW